MTRKFAALVITTLLLLGLFPAMALASAPGTARLTTGTNVLPGTATYGIQVSATLQTINAVRIDLPAGEAGVRNNSDAITAPNGWTATRRSTVTGAESIFFRGGSIPGGSNTTFQFTAAVDQPLDRDVAGTFGVALSGDGGMTSQPASLPATGGTLRTIVRILGVETIAPTAPAGVTDGTGTNGQDITFQTSIRNHAQLPVVVTPTLSVRQGNSSTNDSIGTPSPENSSIASGGTATFAFPVKLGTSNSTRELTFTGGGRATDSTALSRSVAFTSQLAPSLANLRNLAPRLVRPDTDVTFSLDTQKRGVPALTLFGGSLTFSETTASMTATSFGEGTQDGTLEFSGTVQGQDEDAEEEYPVSVTFTGVDANDAPFSQTSNLSDTITIDGLGPKIELNVSLPLDGDGRQQEDAKTGDRITVDGTIDDNSAVIDFVELQPDVGDSIVVPVTRVRGNFTGRVEAPFDLNATEFTAVAQGTDPAGNSGIGTNGPRTIDNIVPVLLGPGVTVQNDDLPSGNGEDVPAIIQIQFTDNGTVKGGCDVKQYSVSGNAVNKVTYSDGSTCVPGEAGPRGGTLGPNNFRLLFLTKPIRRDETPSVSYSPITGDRPKDGAGNFAAAKIIDTVSGIAPIIPELAEVFRNTTTASDDNPCNPSQGHCEVAYFDRDDSSYFTRFGGTDTIARFSGARSGYLVEVLDENDTVLNTKPVSTFTADVRVPLGLTDGSYVRKLRLVNSAGIRGGSLSFTVTLDTVTPFIDSVSQPSTNLNGVTSSSIAFNEKIVKGTDMSFDWNVIERLTNGQIWAYPPDRVSGSGASRTANFTPQDKGAFETIAYDFQDDGGGTRYEDRAGNQLPDNL